MKVNYFIVCAVIILTGCNELSPAGFWKGFDSDHIVEQNSDQGSWGGHRLIYWGNTSEKYSADHVIKFAQANGWRFLSSKVVNDTKLTGWIKGDGTIYVFDSGWIKIENDESHPAYGYVFIYAKNKQMAVYHSWGE